MNTTPHNTPAIDPGPGWRLLKQGEARLHTDEAWSQDMGPWTPLSKVYPSWVTPSPMNEDCHPHRRMILTPAQTAIAAFNALPGAGSDARKLVHVAILLRFLDATGHADVANAYRVASGRTGA